MPKLLDLFCGAGGCSMGYSQAGFEVIGVDLNPQPSYPFEFHQADALEFPLDGFDVIHASPPCQDYSAAMRHLSGDYPRLVEPVRERLVANERPWIIENVPGSPLPYQDTLFGEYGLLLCGTMFGLISRGLAIYRHRLFETSFSIPAPGRCDHRLPAFNPHNGAAREKIFERFGRDDPERPWRELMGVGWMKFFETREAIPPAYTRYVGGMALDLLESVPTSCSSSPA